MYLIDGRQSTVVPLTVGTGGVTKGDLVVWSSNTVVKAAAGDKTDDIVGIALETALDTATAQIELVLDRVIRAPYAGTETNLALGKVYDLTDSTKVNIDDVADGSCLCVGFDKEADTIDFIVVQADRFV
jgi:hypothetical protein